MSDGPADWLQRLRVVESALKAQCSEVAKAVSESASGEPVEQAKGVFSSVVKTIYGTAETVVQEQAPSLEILKKQAGGVVDTVVKAAVVHAAILQENVDHYRNSGDLLPDPTQVVDEARQTLGKVFSSIPTVVSKIEVSIGLLSHHGRDELLVEVARIIVKAKQIFEIGLSDTIKAINDIDLSLFNEKFRKALDLIVRNLAKKAEQLLAFVIHELAERSFAMILKSVQDVDAAVAKHPNYYFCMSLSVAIGRANPVLQGTLIKASLSAVGFGNAGGIVGALWHASVSKAAAGSLPTFFKSAGAKAVLATPPIGGAVQIAAGLAAAFIWFRYIAPGGGQ